MFPSRWFAGNLPVLLLPVIFCATTMTDPSREVSSQGVASATPSIRTSQVREGFCNRGKGTYRCLLTENSKACPAGTHPVLYRAATCAPCTADSKNCPCAPDLYECQQNE